MLQDNPLCAEIASLRKSITTMEKRISSYYVFKTITNDTIIGMREKLKDFMNECDKKESLKRRLVATGCSHDIIPVHVGFTLFQCIMIVIVAVLITTLLVFAGFYCIYLLMRNNRVHNPPSAPSTLSLQVDLETSKKPPSWVNAWFNGLERKSRK